MALQLLEYPLTSQNQRVGDLGGLTSELKRATFPSRDDRSAQIEQAYRQIFFHAIGGFKTGYVICNTNYRLVDQVIGRVLGRQTHGQSERISWSIRIAEKGFNTFVDQDLKQR